MDPKKRKQVIQNAINDAIIGSQISHSWTQKMEPGYHNHGMSSWGLAVNYTNSPEMAVLEAVDHIVEAMTSYPDAERIINKIIGDAEK